MYVDIFTEAAAQCVTQSRYFLSVIWTFPATFVGTNPEIILWVIWTFQLIFVVTKPEIVDELSGRFHPSLWWQKQVF